MCKYYQGPGEKDFENELKRLFHRVYREKPESSRSVSLLYQLVFLYLPGLANEYAQESKEAYFIGIRRRSEKTPKKLEYLDSFRA